MFQECFKKDLRVRQGRLRGVPRDLQVKSKGGSRVSKISSKGVSREFQRRFKEVSREFKECLKWASREFEKKFQGCVKNISTIIFFLILLLHSTHRSYLSRRSTCFFNKTSITIFLSSIYIVSSRTQETCIVSPQWTLNATFN